MNDNDLDKELKERDRQHGIADPGDLQQFFRALVSAYLNYPDNLKLEFKHGHRFWALIVEPDVSDYAIMAGKLGRNFNALKVLVLAIGKYQQLEIELLLEGPPKDDTRHIRKPLPYRINREWTPNTIKALVSRTLQLAGMSHIQLKLQKNRIVNEANPFDDQTFYWFVGMRENAEMVFVIALGQLMEAMGIAGGQRLNPRSKIEPLEKTA